MNIGTDVVAGAMAGVASQHVNDTIKENKTEVGIELLLTDIRDTIEKLHHFIVEQPANKPEIKFVQVLDKINKFRPNTELRYRIKILVPVATIINLQVSGLGAFIVQPTVGQWVDFSFPDGFTMQLDSTNTNATQAVVIRYTNEVIS